MCRCRRRSFDQGRRNATSVSTITSSLLSQIAGSPSAANQFVTDLNQLVKDVNSGNLAAAQQDWVTLSEDAQNGVTSSTATTSDSGIGTTALSDIAASSIGSSSFVNELNLLGNDLQNGDLSTARNDLQSINSTAQSAVSSASANSTTSANPKEIAELIRAIVAALSSGDSSAASSVMSELASVSPNAKGAAALQQQSENLGANSSSSSSLSSLLQSLNSNGSNSSGLSLLA